MKHLCSILFVTVFFVPDMKQQLMKLKTTKGERIESIAPVWKDVGFLMDLDPVATGTKCMHTN